ncbi:MULTISPECIES: cytochrome c [unclassified Methylobacterium]|uniref:cytochrome c n=1 Tax=unclassified Methylobacterium TaxID=2615210 RepID=UPI001FBBD1BB|nr:MULTISPECIES: cytochrome c [unclassified Methylobacterium]MCJ2016647.1 cytochrome c [Methylobacterium sp. E-065]
MYRFIRTAALASLLASASSALAATPLELHPTPEVDLPVGDDVAFPNGSGSDVIASNCTACHSADHTLNQPALSREEWHTVVDKMINAYKAPITSEDARVIVDYLARIKGEP